MNILVTGAAGFLGKNLVENLKCLRDGKNRTRPELSINEIYEYDKDGTPGQLREYCEKADFVFHCAGVNRPNDDSEFMAGNFGFTSTLLTMLKECENRVPIVITSSVQATLAGRFGDSEYGRSKLAGEELMFEYGDETGTEVYVYRFPNLVGKWGRPEYNSAVITFCHHVANDLPIRVDDPATELELLFVEDLLEEFYDCMEGHPHRCEYPKGEVTMERTPTALGSREMPPHMRSEEMPPHIRSTADRSPMERTPAALGSLAASRSPIEKSTASMGSLVYDGVTPREDENGRYCFCPVTHKATLGRIVELLNVFKDQPTSLILPRIPEGSFEKKLYSMYLSYLPSSKLVVDIPMSVDERGSFTEVFKSLAHGQFSINVSKPGKVKGQHWHNEKWEIFVVVSGRGLIQERKLGIDPETGREYEPVEFEVSGEKLQMVYCIPGYAHNIINLSDTQDLITLMYANEIFDANHPETYREDV